MGNELIVCNVHDEVLQLSIFNYLHGVLNHVVVKWNRKSGAAL